MSNDLDLHMELVTYCLNRKSRKEYIVGSSCATSKFYNTGAKSPRTLAMGVCQKIHTSIKGDTYEWACKVKIDPTVFEITLKENTYRMLSRYNIDMEEYE